MADTAQQILNKTVLNTIAKELKGKYDVYKKDRQGLEQRMLRNRRQFRGEYDPEVLRILDQDPTKSKAYPRITRVKVIGLVSRLMDLLFPRTEKNWELEPTPFPNISQEDLQTLLDAMPQDVPVDGDMIEKAIMALAKKRSERMEKTMVDQLADNDLNYPALARKIIMNAVLYGFGVLKGPLVRQEDRRTWEKDTMTGRFKAITKQVYAPYYEPVSPWAFYPDLKAKSRKSMDGAFERHIYSKHELKQLAKRSDFFKDALDKFIADNPTGNYVEETFEGELRAEKGSDTNNVRKGENKYEVIEWWGYHSTDRLKQSGIPMSGKGDNETVMINMWIIGETAIKAIVSPYPENVNIHHIFVYEEDDTSILGIALPEVIRESQLATAAAARMLLDNSSLSCGLNLEVNRDLLLPNQTTTIHPYKVWEREGLGNEAQIPAVREIKFDAHIAELQGVMNEFQRMADTESLLPQSMMGDMGGGGSASEPFRTAQNTSQLLGAAALPIRDVVRNFDQFTESVLTSLYNWNMTFSDDPEIKGDYTIKAIGSTSLVAKEVRSYALDNLMTTLTEEEKAWIKTKDILVERLAVRDLPESLLKSQEEYEADMKRQAEAAKPQQDLIAAQIAKENATASKIEADAALSGARVMHTQADTGMKQAQTDALPMEKVMQAIQALSNANKQGRSE